MVKWIKIAKYGEEQGTLENAIRETEKRGLRIHSLNELDDRLLKTEEWQKKPEMYPCRSGTFMAHEAVGKPLGKTIEWEGYKVIVPKKFQGKKDVALVCNHPDFQLKDKVFTSSKFVGIKIPVQDGWYVPESKFGIPVGEKKDGSAANQRHFWRYQGEPYIGLVVRWDYYVLGYDYRRYVGAFSRPNGRFGVFACSRNFKGKAQKHKHEFVCACGAKR